MSKKELKEEKLKEIAGGQQCLRKPCSPPAKRK